VRVDSSFIAQLAIFVGTNSKVCTFFWLTIPFASSFGDLAIFTMCIYE